MPLTLLPAPPPFWIQKAIYTSAYYSSTYRFAVHIKYREFLPYANFITVNFIIAVFQIFPDIEVKIWLMLFYGLFILLLRIYMANAIFG